MKILVPCKQVRLDTTSEGICTSKFLAMLAAAGHDVCCLTGDRLDVEGPDRAAAWLPRTATVRRVDEFSGRGIWTRVSRISHEATATGTGGEWVDRKFNAAVTYSTGYSSHVWREVDTWRRAIQQCAADAPPDVIITRAAGAQFEPHVAMSTLRLGIPWIANYHDPFPTSLYPPPYRHRVPLVSWWQERLHRRIIRAADALTFPSARLLRWVLKGDLAAYRQKGFVISHVADGMGSTAVDEAGGAAADDRFTIVHAGTLLHQRDPQPLLRAFLEFLGQDKERRGRARLVFVGRVHRNHAAYPEWAALEHAGAIQKIEERVSYATAMAMCSRATAVIVLEAACSESPFFPAKLADYLSLKRPILALSPRESSTADLLGLDYRLLVPPQDTSGITAALNTLWDAWSAGRLTELLPSPDVAQACSRPAVQIQIGQLLDVVRRDPRPVTTLLAPQPASPR